HTTPSLTYTLSLHDALPISHATRTPSHPAQWSASPLDSSALWLSARSRPPSRCQPRAACPCASGRGGAHVCLVYRHPPGRKRVRSEEHTSELQSRGHLVCRL